MGYYIDLSSISIDEYKVKLETAVMIPSRMILKERLDERFTYIKNLGIKNIEELQKILNKKDKLKEIQTVECLSGEYLTILSREINSIHPNPNRLKDFIGISNTTILKLESIGIKDTFKLFDKVKNRSLRNELSKETGISQIEILELTKLTDLSRIKWVGATFARVLFETGFDTVEKVAKANYEELYQKILLLNKEKNLYKGNIGLNDMKICVNAAKEVPSEIEY